MIRIFITHIFIFFICSNLPAQQCTVLKIDTSAVANFWKHFDVFLQDTTQNPFTDYMRELPAGVKSFAPYPLGDSAKFKKTVQKELSYYKAVRPYTNRISTALPAMKTYCEKFNEVFPDSQTPDIYFVIGRANSGASINEEGVMFGTEMYSTQPDSTTYGFKAMKHSEIAEIFLNCLIYYNNKPAYTGYTILRQSIMEGTSLYLSAMISQKVKERLQTEPAFKYGEANEEGLVREFWAVRNDNNFSGWLYDRKLPNGRPGNLGSFIGYKIVESYYQNSPDKRKAIDDILKINDFEKFVKISGYIDQFLSY